MNTVKVTFLGREVEFGEAVDSERCVFRGLTIDGVEFGLDEYKSGKLWHCDYDDLVGIGSTAQEAAADLERKLMPLGRLLSWRWREHVRQLENVVNCASHTIGVLGNETDDAKHVVAIRDLSDVVTEYGNWRWQQPAPELFPMSEVQRVKTEKIDE